MVKIDLIYESDLRCRLTHGPSKAEIVTDAPVDNQGKGAAFSPTDLLAAALGSCIMTVMGIAARAHQININGAKARIEKEMITSPVRRVGKLTVNLTLPAGILPAQRATLERVAHTCPVHRSLNPEIEVLITLNYPD